MDQAYGTLPFISLSLLKNKAPRDCQQNNKKIEYKSARNRKWKGKHKQMRREGRKGKERERKERKGLDFNTTGKKTFSNFSSLGQHTLH